MSVINIKNMPPSEKRKAIQEPLYALFRQLFKGPLYETPDFCFQKCIDDTAEIFKVAFSFESNQLIGASVLKIIPTDEIYDGKLVSLLEITAGYLPEFRGNRHLTQFVLQEMIEYKRNNPEKLLCFCDLITSPLSYAIFFNYPFEIYPKYDEKTPEKIEKLLLRLIDRMPQYRSFQNPDPLIRQGAKPRETHEQYYARLMRGAQNNPHIQYFYEKTQGVLGWGFFIIQLIDQSANDIENIVKNRMVQRGTGKKKFYFMVPNLSNTDFIYLNQLRAQKDSWKNKTIASMMPQHVSIQLSDIDQCAMKKAFSAIGYFGEILYCQPMKNISYVQRAKILSQQKTQLIFYHDRHAIFEVTVPIGVFNPFTGPMAAKFIEMILHGDIDVQGKSMVDLGCGCGNIGLVAILMGVDHVLFTDINPNFIESLKNHPLINVHEHTIMVQDLLTDTLKHDHKKYDLLIMSTPTFNNTKMIDNANLYQQRDFFQRLITQASQILNDNGELILWSMLSNFNQDNMMKFLSNFSSYFDINTLTVLSIEFQKNIPIFSENEIGENNVYLLYKIKRTAKTCKTHCSLASEIHHLLS